ncbi:MAG: hypothetical protein ACXVW6_03530 [Nocardioidaceae bacterium]
MSYETVRGRRQCAGQLDQPGGEAEQDAGGEAVTGRLNPPAAAAGPRCRCDRREAAQDEERQRCRGRGGTRGVGPDEDQEERQPGGGHGDRPELAQRRKATLERGTHRDSEHDAGDDDRLYDDQQAEMQGYGVQREGHQADDLPQQPPRSAGEGPEKPGRAEGVVHLPVRVVLQRRGHSEARRGQGGDRDCDQRHPSTLEAQRDTGMKGVNPSKPGAVIVWLTEDGAAAHP